MFFIKIMIVSLFFVFIIIFVITTQFRVDFQSYYLNYPYLKDFE